MLKDCQGNKVEGATSESLACYERAVRTFNIYRGDPVAEVDRAIEISPDFAMAHILKAYLFVMATEPEANEATKAIVAGLKSNRLDERARSHVEALDAIASGNWTKGAVLLDRHNMRYPHDLVGIQAGHLADFYRGNTRNLRDRILRVLPHWDADIPGYSIVVGFSAFGYEEAGNYARAEDAGRKALHLEPLDCWAHHAVAHVMEMQGRSQDGIGWMIAREKEWSGEDNIFKVHNWWHRAIFHLDLCQMDDALALYDTAIRIDRSETALDMVDASALLWRLQASGHDVGDRWKELSDDWIQHANGELYPFNDWHGVMSHLGAERQERVDDVLAAYRRDSNGASEVDAWRRDIGLPVIEGFLAFHAGKYDQAVEKLHPVRFIANAFGGSHAQRDVIDWTLTEAAIRGGLTDVAMALANERLGHKPYSPMNNLFRARISNDGSRASVTV